jgi:hypothetical protein
MKDCQQTNTQSVYEHGVSVRDHVFQLIDYLKTGTIKNDWRLPDWLTQYKSQIFESLCPLNIIEEYTIYHDCGKPYCITIDKAGRRHFPDHADVSARTWQDAGGCTQVQKLISMDMVVHTMKAADIDEFIKHSEAITLLLTALAEIHSNAKMFGGIESESFKIKWNQINKRGKAICQKLWS